MPYVSWMLCIPVTFQTASQMHFCRDGETLLGLIQNQFVFMNFPGKCPRQGWAVGICPVSDEFFPNNNVHIVGSNSHSEILSPVDVLTCPDLHYLHNATNGRETVPIIPRYPCMPWSRACWGNGREFSHYKKGRVKYCWEKLKQLQNYFLFRWSNTWPKHSKCRQGYNWYDLKRK